MNDLELQISELLEKAGYDPLSQHFVGTPRRWARVIEEFSCPRESAEDILSIEFDETYRGMVLLRNVMYTSLCPHHLLPYMGLAHVAYLPSGKVVGLSKLARLVEYHTHRIVVQEESTRAIVDDIQRLLKPVGVIAVLTGTHTCLSARGIRANGSDTTTADLRGAFKENAHGCRDEFYAMLAMNFSS